MKKTPQQVRDEVRAAVNEVAQKNPDDFVEVTYKGRAGIVNSDNLQGYGLYSYGLLNTGDKVTVLKVDQEAKPRIFHMEQESPKKKRRATRKKKVSE